MARNVLDTWIRMDRVHCHDEGDGWGNAEPYLWAVFFKVDGSTVRLNTSLNLEGTATVVATNGSHGNLDDTDVDAGDDVSVPEDVGSWNTRMIPIPVPESVAPIVPDVAGVAGVVVVLMEEDNVSDGGALAGYNALVNELQQRLDVLIPQLGFAHQEVTDEDVAALQAGIGDAISSAVQGAQSGWQNFWSWLNADDQIGSKFFSFGHDTLAAGNVINFSQRWGNEGDWEVFGHANASVVCPASAASAISASLGSALGAQHLDSLRRFRDSQVRKDRTLASWWSLAERNSAALSHLFLTDRQAREAMLAALPRISQVLDDPRATLPDEVVESAQVVLTRASQSPSRQLRSDAALAKDLMGLMPGRTVAHAVALGSAIEPKRGNRRADVQATVRRITATRPTRPPVGPGGATPRRPN